MKTRAAKTGAFVGAGIGLALFAVFGLLYGSFIGGVAGLHLANQMFASTGEPGVLSRMVLALGVMFGVLIAAAICVLGTALVGYLVGTAIDLTHMEETESAIKAH